MSKKTTACPILAILKSPQGVHNLTKDRISIGRSKTSTIPISHPSISKDHALIEFDNDQIALIKDLNSSNGTYVNNTRLQSTPVQLKTNDKISFGKDSTVYIFESFNQENEKTEIYPTIHDEKISLVNDDNYQSARVNHFQNKQRQYGSNTSSSPNEYQSAKFTFPNQQQPHQQQLHGGVSHYNQNYNEEEIVGMNEQNVTFKNNNSKGNDDLIHQMQLMSIEKEELATKALDNEKKILEKGNEVKKMTDLFDQLSEEYSKLNAKHNALMVYASDLQKKVDLYELELNDLKDNNNTDKVDIGKMLSEKDSIITILQNETNYYKDQIQKIKSNISPMMSYPNINNNDTMQMMNTANSNTQLMNKLDDLIESYIKENREQKSTIDQLREINIGNNTQSEFNQRTQRDTDIKFFQEQINTQITNFNTIISDYDTRLSNALNQLPALFEEEKKETAAKFLVEQVNTFMEENQRLLNENATLNGKIAEVQNELEFSNKERTTMRSDIMKENSNEATMRKLNDRIEELGTVISKLKNDKERSLSQTNMNMTGGMGNTGMGNMTGVMQQQQQQVQEVNMKECLMSALNQLKDKEKAIEDLKGKLKETISKTNVNFDERQIVSSMSETLREKDSMIMNLQNQLKASRDCTGTQNSFNNQAVGFGSGTQSRFDELMMNRDAFVNSINH